MHSQHTQEQPLHLLKKDGMENIRESERNPLPCARSGGVMLVAWAQMLEAVLCHSQMSASADLTWLFTQSTVPGE
jgi:hypothetical protein